MRLSCVASETNLVWAPRQPDRQKPRPIPADVRRVIRLMTWGDDTNPDALPLDMIAACAAANVAAYRMRRYLTRPAVIAYLRAEARCSARLLVVETQLRCGKSEIRARRNGDRCQCAGVGWNASRGSRASGCPIAWCQPRGECCDRVLFCVAIGKHMGRSAQKTGVSGKQASTENTALFARPSVSQQRF